MQNTFGRPASVVIVALSLGSAACSSDVERDPIAESRDPIFGGQPPNADHHRAVVSLHQRVGSSVSTSIFCSGTLIAPDVVLTAAHCLDIQSGNKSTFKTRSPSSVAIYVGDNPSLGMAGNTYLVSEAVIHPSYNRNALLNDLGTIRLQTSVPATAANPVPHLPSALALAEADVGVTLLNFAGFGYDEGGGIGVKLQVDDVLGGLGCSVPGCGSAGNASTQFSYVQTAVGPCSGDSGGPAFVTRNGTAYVAGITSYGDSYPCDLYGVSTKVDAFQAYLDAYLAPAPDCSANGSCNDECAAGADPDCGGAGTCGDHVCDANESCDGRNGTAACMVDCPGKTSGKASMRYCWVSGACTGPGCM